jgi:DNA processing protein
MMSLTLTPDLVWWPTQLADLDSPPKQLFYAGDPTLLKSPMLAIVGARANTEYGHRVTSHIVYGLSRQFVIISGGAFGIDEAAHRAAMRNGDKTVVVHAGGHEHLYPSAHQQLFDQIVDTGGLIISEWPPDTVVSRDRFLARNRIVAALSQGVLVVEAGRQSGTMNTAGWAKLLRRPLMAVPGPVTSAASAGCHVLIREGAHLVTGPNDVLDVLAGRRGDRS